MPVLVITGTGVRRESEGTGTITPMGDMNSVEITAGRIGPQRQIVGAGVVASQSRRSHSEAGRFQFIR